MKGISPEIQKLAPVILAEIQKAKSILLHCHPSPDPDSVGSALAMKFALEQMGKKATVIKGDSEMPWAYRNLPGISGMVTKNFGEVDLSAYDLFVSVDAAVPLQISRYKTPEFPLSIPTIVIDHHVSNSKYGLINLVVPEYPATAQVLYDLFISWRIDITSQIAMNLFAGMYTDTGGFSYPSTTPRTLQVASALVEKAPDFPSVLSDIKNSNSQGFVRFSGLALSHIQIFCNGALAVSSISAPQISTQGIDEADVRVSEVASFMRTVPEWAISICMAEVVPGRIRVSSRTNNGDKYDLSKLMKAIGGGGHKAAAASIVIDKGLDETIDIIIRTAKELYNL